MDDETNAQDFHIRRERREYPIPDQGVHKAVCTKAELQLNPFENADPEDKIIKLWWQLEGTYKDDEDKDRNFMVFSKAIGRRFSPKASLYKLCKDLTGKEPWQERTEVKEGDKTFDDYVFNHKCFEGMVCDIVVKHNESKGRIYANAESYITSAEQKAENTKLVPATDDVAPAPKKKASKKKSDTESEEAEEEKEIADVEPPPGPAEKIVEQIGKAKDADELENVKTLLIDDSSLEGDEKASVDKAYKKRADELK